jgi:hypothetical protein
MNLSDTTVNLLLGSGVAWFTYLYLSQNKPSLFYDDKGILKVSPFTSETVSVVAYCAAVGFAAVVVANVATGKPWRGATGNVFSATLLGASGQPSTMKSIPVW